MTICAAADARAAKGDTACARVGRGVVIASEGLPVDSTLDGSGRGDVWEDGGDIRDDRIDLPCACEDVRGVLA